MPLSDWIPLASSNLDAYRYDVDAEELQVRFKGAGKVYSYAGVDAETVAALASAESPGRFFASAIKGAFPASAVE